MLNFYPWGLSLNLVQPEAINCTRVAFLSYVWDKSELDIGAGAALHQVEMEDEAIMELCSEAQVRVFTVMDDTRRRVNRARITFIDCCASLCVGPTKY